MSGSAARHPVAMMGGAGLLAGALAVNVIASPALIALAASLLTAAALAPLIVGAGQEGGQDGGQDDTQIEWRGDWAGRLMAQASDALGRTWPGLRLQSARDRRQRVFAFLAGLNVAVFASFFLRGGG